MCVLVARIYLGRTNPFKHMSPISVGRQNCMCVANARVFMYKYMHPIVLASKSYNWPQSGYVVQVKRCSIQTIRRLDTQVVSVCLQMKEPDFHQV
jgi:hypothetical protein